jgi:hypothetical protein
LASSTACSIVSHRGLVTHELRTFTGFYGQLAVVLGKLHLAGGYGMSLVNQTPGDKVNARSA